MTTLKGMVEAGSGIMALWSALAKVPGGRKVFSTILGKYVPYTGTIRPEVVELEPGYAKVRFSDRRAVRNHLGSVHAVALVNLAEMAASLAVTTNQPSDGRWIVTGLDTEYLKKARGSITAECRMPEVDWSVSSDLTGEVRLTNAEGVLVCRVCPRWRIGPR
jgi:acyl-coenzyme A thioesterase PaaI-like protein